MAGVLGVLGGMGALASAAFVSTLYRHNPAPTEQGQPIILLRSNPQIPDRTTALFEGRHAELTAAIEQELDLLRASGADRMVICCITAHAIWPRLSEQARARTISLLDALFDTPELGARRRLVLCTEATRKLGLVQDHPAFARFADQLVFTDAAGQVAIHKIIYQLKHGAQPASTLSTLIKLAEDAGATGFVAACTEMHLLGELPESFDMIDPLTTIAQRLTTLLA